MKRGLEVGFLLDQLWHQIRGEMEQSKRPALSALAAVLAEASVPYAVIGGVALQVHQDEPRTTLDIDLAVTTRAAIPAAGLEKQGFRRSGSYEHTENWESADGIPVRFTADPALAGAIERAEVIDLGGIPLKVIRRVDLLHEKLRAGADPARRRSKRIRDLADAQSLIEVDPALVAELSSAERQLLDDLPG